MNIELVRILDYYLGIPLCLFGTFLLGILDICRPKPPAKRPENVLFVELSEMGSVILADPAMAKIRKELHANLFFVIFRKNSESLQLLNTVPRENVFVMADASIFQVAADLYRFLRWTRSKRIDTVIDLELFSRFTALLSGFSGAVNRVGFHAFHNEGLYRGNFLTHKVAYNPHLHIAKSFIALVNALLTDHQEIPYSKTVISDSELSIRQVAISTEAREMMLTKVAAASPRYSARDDRLVIFNCNASDLIPLRRWPQEHYVSLARQILTDYPGIVILLTGSRSERADKDAIIAAVGDDRCINFAGETRLEELPALYSLSEFMLTNDSGPAHFAAVTAMPTYILFGPETPKIYAPLGHMTPIYSGLACSPCVAATNHRKSVCTDNVCLQVITPEHVFALLRPALEQH
jgi:ADP-heptose:LPS heptosyltransferase